MKASSLIKLSELKESIKAVMPTLTFILTEMEACLRSAGQVALTVQGRLINGINSGSILCRLAYLAKCPFFEQLWQTAPWAV